MHYDIIIRIKAKIEDKNIIANKGALYMIAFLSKYINERIMDALSKAIMDSALSSGVRKRDRPFDII